MAESSCTRPRTLCFLRTRTATTKPMIARCSSADGERATLTLARATCDTASITGFMERSATPVSTGRSAVKSTISGWASIASSPTGHSSNSCAVQITTPGVSVSAKRTSFSPPRPTTMRAATCRSRIASTKRFGDGQRNGSARSPRARSFIRLPKRSGRSTHTAVSPRAQGTRSTRPASFLNSIGTELPS